MAKQIHGITDLTPDPANANKGTDRGRHMVEASLRETGAGRSIVADKDGRIIAGNKTMEAWKEMGGEIEVIRTDGKRLVVVQRDDLDLTDDAGQARKLAYLDNRAGEVGLSWDAERILADINAGVDFDGMFLQEELDELLAGVLPPPDPAEDPGAQVDRAEELRQAWGVEVGQMWQLGEHRLICGDCTDAAVVDRVMGGDEINLGFTSPPYAEQREYDKESGFKTIAPDDYVEWFRPVADNVSRHIASDGSWFVNICPGAENRQRRRYVLDLVVAHLSAEWGWLFLDEYVWPAGQMPLDPRQIGRFKHGFEMIFGFSKTTEYQFYPDNVRHESDAAFTYGGVDARISHDYQGSAELTRRTSMQKVGPGLAYPSTLLSKIGKDGVIGHAAAFPVGLPSFFVKAYTDVGGIVYEPFSGSGTTLIACEQLSRKCRAVEISPAYCAVALERWATMTGKTPTLLTD